MKRFRFLIPASVLLSLFIVVLPAGAQRGGGSSSTQGPAPAGPQTGANQTGEPASNQPAPTTPGLSNATPLLVTGNVLLSDGTKAPLDTKVGIVCASGTFRGAAYIDASGNFNIVITGGPAGGRGSGGIDVERGLGRTGVLQSGAASLSGCEVKAVLGGYRSTSIILDRQSALDDPNVGTIYLHRLAAGEAEGYTVSLTTKLAPKDARRAYEKGLDSKKKQKWSEAEQELSNAVTAYPQYAVAWYELGRVYQQENKSDDAFRAHQKAVEAEPKFVNPYAELTTLAFRQQKWEEVVGYTSQFIRLAPFTPPEIFFYNAAANYNLHRIDSAEKSARTAARLDSKHKVPRINFILGLILEEKEDWTHAAENLRLYLQYSPTATDKLAIERELTKVDAKRLTRSNTAEGR